MLRSDPSMKFIEKIKENFLSQHISIPTRFDKISNLILDSIFTNDEQFIHQVEISHFLGLSDHCIISFDSVSKCEVYAVFDDPCQNYFILDREGHPSLAKELSAVNWSTEVKGLTVDEMITFLVYKLSSLMDRYIPHKIYKISKTVSVKNNLELLFGMTRKTFVAECSEKKNSFVLS